MTISIEEKRKEAVDRMRQMNLFPETVRQFEEDGKVSESVPPVGACYWIDEDQQSIVKDFEETHHDAIVYHIIHGTYVFGGADVMETECFLYVSDNPEEWELDREDIDNGAVLCYIYNKTYPDMSEIGSIGFEVGAAGGLVRTW